MKYIDKEVLDLVNERVKFAKTIGMDNQTIADMVEEVINKLPDTYSSNLISTLWKMQENILMNRF